MTRKRFFLLFFLIFVLSACGGQSNESISGDFPLRSEPPAFSEDQSGADADFSGEVADGYGYDDATVTNIAQNNLNPAQQPEAQERLIIRTGNLDIVVQDTETRLQEIGRLAERLGGWVVTSEVRQTGQNAKAGSITLRVPAEQFDVLVNQIKEMALEVTWESTNSQDVTEEYVDLASRLGNLEATADRVRAFLDEAESVEEALQVNQELSRLEGEIEVIKGRMQYLSQSAAFSTLTVSLTPDALSQPIEVAGWRPEGTARDAIEGLIGTLQGLADIGIFLVLYLLPLALLFGVPGYLLFRFGRNWWRKRGEVGVSQPAE